jgi:putative phosphoribosyl transferase
MFFKDRKDGGRQLLPLLGKYKDHKDVVVLGLPRGGVVTAFEVATGLGVPLDVIVSRKIGAPGNPELAIGATTEDGEAVLNEALLKTYDISPEFVEEETRKETAEAQRRIKTYRAGRMPLNLKAKIVVLVDDGMATGYTMRAAIRSVKAQHPQRIVVAVPVSPEDTAAELLPLADELIILYIPAIFGAVGSFYSSFDQTTDKEVIDLMRSAEVC